MSGGNEPRIASPTIFDVAKLADVSHQTVSRVLNDHPNVRPATQARVRQAIEQLRYRPNLAARAMGGRKSRNLGLITAGSPDYGPSSTVLGLLAAARTQHYTVSLATAVDTEPESVRAAVNLVLGQHVDAIVLVASRRQNLDAVAGLDLQIPLVIVESSGRTAQSLSIDQYTGAKTATEHLIGLGHRSIVHLAGPGDAMDATERLRGWRDTMSVHGLVAPPAPEGDWTPASGYQLGQRLLADGRTFSAVFVANDQMALGLIHALDDRRCHVPEDVSIIGFDDIPEAEHFSPPLTTMRQDFRQLGGSVMAVVIAAIEEQPQLPTQALTPQLITRESTALCRTDRSR